MIFLKRTRLVTDMVFIPKNKRIQILAVPSESVEEEKDVGLFVGIPSSVVSKEHCAYKVVNMAADCVMELFIDDTIFVENHMVEHIKEINVFLIRENYVLGRLKTDEDED